MQAAWKVSNVAISVKKDSGKEAARVSEPLAERVSWLLRRQRTLPLNSISVLRKTFDPRHHKIGKGVFMYVVLVDADAVAEAGGPDLAEHEGLRVRWAPPLA
jgi:hypothetical protein